MGLLLEESVDRGHAAVDRLLELAIEHERLTEPRGTHRNLTIVRAAHHRNGRSVHGLLRGGTGHLRLCHASETERCTQDGNGPEHVSSKSHV